MGRVGERIGCIVMASGLSERYGKNKLLEMLGSREVIWHTAMHLRKAGLEPLIVTRSREVQDLAEREGFLCVLHDEARKSDTMHVGLRYLDSNMAGYLFMPGDQPLVLPSSLGKLTERFLAVPERAVRLGFGGTAGSPVVFPAFLRDDLLAYTGERGGLDVLRNRQLSCDIVQASYDWELWDVDTPEKMKQVKEVYADFALI